MSLVQSLGTILMSGLQNMGTAASLALSNGTEATRAAALNTLGVFSSLREGFNAGLNGISYVRRAAQGAANILPLLSDAHSALFQEKAKAIAVLTQKALQQSTHSFNAFMNSHQISIELKNTILKVPQEQRKEKIFKEFGVHVAEASPQEIEERLNFLSEQRETAIKELFARDFEAQRAPLQEALSALNRLFEPTAEEAEPLFDEERLAELNTIIEEINRLSAPPSPEETRTEDENARIKSEIMQLEKRLKALLPSSVLSPERLHALKEATETLIITYSAANFRTNLPFLGLVDQPTVLSLLSKGADFLAPPTAEPSKKNGGDAIYTLRDKLEAKKREGATPNGFVYTAEDKRKDFEDNLAYQFKVLTTKIQRTGSVVLVLEKLFNNKDTSALRTSLDQRFFLNEKEFEEIRLRKKIEILLRNPDSRKKIVDEFLRLKIIDKASADALSASEKDVSNSLKAHKAAWNKLAQQSILNDQRITSLKSFLKTIPIKDANLQEEFRTAILSEVSRRTSILNKKYRIEIFNEINKLTEPYFILFRPIIQLFCYLVYFVSFWLIGRSVAPLSNTLYKKLLKFIAKGANTSDKDTRYANIENWLLDGIRGYLTNLRDVYAKVAKDADGVGTLEERLEAEFKKPQYNLGKKPEELYDLATEVLIKNLIKIPFIHTLIAGQIKSARIIPSLIQTVETSNFDPLGYAHALDQFFIAILERVNKQLDPKEESDGRTSHSDTRKRRLQNLINGLFTTINFYNINDIQQLSQALENPFTFVDRFLILPLAGIAADIMAVGFEDSLNPEFLAETADELLAILNQSFNPTEKVTQIEKERLERRIVTISKEILKKAVDTGIDTVAPILSNTDETVFSFEYLSKFKYDLYSFISIFETNLALVEDPLSLDENKTALIKVIADFTDCCDALSTDIDNSTKATDAVKMQIKQQISMIVKIVNELFDKVEALDKEGMRSKLKEIKAQLKDKAFHYQVVVNPFGEKTTASIKHFTNITVSNSLEEKLKGLLAFFRDPMTLRRMVIHELILHPFVKATQKV